ncbi:hypothetical protein N752_06005 [Desulforamulus aquiferis]|nr:hypothetical protein N752_06005 [Desulforamulus aquiferis]
MDNELIFRILNMSITATFMALAVIFLRLLLRKAPKWISYILKWFSRLNLGND